MANEPRDEQSSALLDNNNIDYNAIFGTTGADQKYSKSTIIGDVRNPKRLTWLEWTFLALSAVAFLGTLAVTIERFVTFEKNFNLTQNGSEEYRLDECDSWKCTSDYTYTVLLIINIFFCLFYAVDGVIRERGFEILAVPVAVLVVVVYIISNYAYQQHELHDHARIARLILAVLFGPPLAILAVLIYIRHGRLQFNIVGSNKTLMRIYTTRSFANTLLTFNIHLLCNFVTLVLVRQFTFISSAEHVIVGIYIVYVIVITPIAFVGYNYEMILPTIVFVVLFLPTSAYYVYKIIDVALKFQDFLNVEGNYNNNDETYRFISITLLIVCCIGLLLYCLILLFALIVARDYNKGLNDKVKPPFLSLCSRLGNNMRIQRELDNSKSLNEKL